ncbi:hypothetical protein JCM8547_002651 [Rhodosporidiobolus lusitaniae]
MFTVGPVGTFRVFVSVAFLLYPPPPVPKPLSFSGAFAHQHALHLALDRIATRNAQAATAARTLLQAEQNLNVLLEEHITDPTAQANLPVDLLELARQAVEVGDLPYHLSTPIVRELVAFPDRETTSIVRNQSLRLVARLAAQSLLELLRRRRERLVDDREAQCTHSDLVVKVGDLSFDIVSAFPCFERPGLYRQISSLFAYVSETVRPVFPAPAVPPFPLWVKALYALLDSPNFPDVAHHLVEPALAFVEAGVDDVRIEQHLLDALLDAVIERNNVKRVFKEWKVEEMRRKEG